MPLWLRNVCERGLCWNFESNNSSTMTIAAVARGAPRTWYEREPLHITRPGARPGRHVRNQQQREQHGANCTRDMLWLLLGTTALAVAVAVALTHLLRNREVATSDAKLICAPCAGQNNNQYSRQAEAAEANNGVLDESMPRASISHRRSVLPGDVLLSVRESESLLAAKRPTGPPPASERRPGARHCLNRILFNDAGDSRGAASVAGAACVAGPLCRGRHAFAQLPRGRRARPSLSRQRSSPNHLNIT